MPAERIIDGEKYILDTMHVFSGDKNRRAAELKKNGHSVRTFLERHEGDNTGAWIIYRSEKTRQSRKDWSDKYFAKMQSEEPESEYSIPKRCKNCGGSYPRRYNSSGKKRFCIYCKKKLVLV